MYGSIFCRCELHFLIETVVAPIVRATVSSWANSTLACCNNLEKTTYRYGAVSGKSDFHVDISKYPGGEFLFSTWGIKNSSEESNETSEEMNDAHVENKKYPRGEFRFSTWIFEKGGNRTNFRVKICK